MGEFWEKITGSIGTGNGAGGSGPPKWFRRDNLLILVLLGVLLFIIALPVKKEEPQAASVGTETAEQYNAGIFTSPSQTTGEQETAVDTETRAVAAGSAEEYTAYLEGKLKKMLESVRGLGEVEVMITLESSEERIVEKDMTADMFPVTHFSNTLTLWASTPKSACAICVISLVILPFPAPSATTSTPSTWGVIVFATNGVP